MSITSDDVRTALNEIDQKAIPDAVIDQKIGQAQVIVQDQAVKQDDDHYDYAITQTAAYLAFTASPPMEQKRALDASAQWDVEGFIQNLKNQMELAMQTAGGGSGGTSAAFTDHTGGAIRDAPGFWDY